jgi:hypothetical protein
MLVAQEQYPFNACVNYALFSSQLSRDEHWNDLSFGCKPIWLGLYVSSVFMVSALVSLPYSVT